MLLKAPDPRGNVRLDAMKPMRGARETAGFVNGQKGAKERDVHPSRIQISIVHKYHYSKRLFPATLSSNASGIGSAMAHSEEKIIETRFTRRFGVKHPVALAPMDKVSGGRLAAAVSDAGGFGLIGGGYGDTAWIDAAFVEAGDARVGIGFITWSALRQDKLLESVLARKPAALMFSFGDAEGAIALAREHAVPVFWQVQRLEQAEQALAAGVDVIVVQGQEAGGHGMDRGLMSLLPAVRDIGGEDQVILGAGGIADGRGLAAALMLGADGILMGTRFCASAEADWPEAAKSELLARGGDETGRMKVFDVARGLDWPWHFSGRVFANAFSRRWQDDIEGLKRNASQERKRFAETAPDDFSVRPIIAGEAADLISSVKPARQIVEDTVRGAAALLANAPQRLRDAGG
jgi:nitronate monooxygenase